MFNPLGTGCCDNVKTHVLYIITYTLLLSTFGNDSEDEASDSELLDNREYMFLSTSAVFSRLKLQPHNSVLPV